MRPAPSAAPAAASGGDPLAELARLIGQNDPFAEFGRQNARQPVQQQPAQSAPARAYADDRYSATPALDQAPQAFAADNRQFDNFPQQYGAAPPNFPSRGPVPGFPPEPGFEQDAEYPTNAHSGADDHDFYDDVPPRRRLGIVAIAAVLGLVVVGTAGAIGYRALFGSSGAKSPPPVIKAEASPTKIVPAAQSKDPKSGKLIYDRVAERGQDEKLVSREEQPVDRPPGAANAAGAPAPMGSSIVATEPKKVHTIAIRPDGTAMADAAPASIAAIASTPQPPPLAAPAPPPARPAVAEQPPQRTQQPTHTEPPPRRTVAAAPSGGPLSLSPDDAAPASAPAAPAPRPARTAVAAPTQTAPVQAAAPASNGGGGYAVQVSSQRSEAEAQAAFHSLAAKYPSQLGGKQPLIRHVDLGAKGVYYRAMVGPLASEEASQLCSSLKAAGGQCIIQRN
jgi:hypothetical protein